MNANFRFEHTQARPTMSVGKYLERIGIEGLPEPTPETLCRIQTAHLQTVPYENLDILMHRPISLAPEALYDKIVLRRRGGYCFEVNELLAWLLRELGYSVTDLFARFLRGESSRPMRRHHVLAVRCPDADGAYLVDVGVGSGSPNRPVRITEGEVLYDGSAVYRLTTDPLDGWLLSEQKDDTWQPVYSFSEERNEAVDFVTTSFWCEYAKESIFNKAPMVSLRTPNGRRTLDGDEARIFDGLSVSTRKLKDPAEQAQILKEWFGIDLTQG